eukprot:gene7516-8313_t
MGCTSSKQQVEDPRNAHYPKAPGDRGSGINLNKDHHDNGSTVHALSSKDDRDSRRQSKPPHTYDSVPSFVIKALRQHSPEKIFINVYQTNEISEDGLILLPIVATEHKGIQCSVYPALLSAIYLTKSQQDLKFLEQLVLHLLVEVNRFNPACTLETASVKLPRIKRGFVGENQQYFSRDLPVKKIVFSGKGTLQLDRENDDDTVKKDERETASTPPAVLVHDQKPPETSTVSNSVVAIPPAIEEGTSVLGTVNTTTDVAPASPFQDVTLPTPPPKMVGWLQKRGHVIKNWKTRYFVLNQGFVAYYTDASDKPPFGEGAKGILCLAGYRDRVTTAAPGTADNEPNGKRRTSLFSLGRGNTEGELRIHLEADPSAMQSLLPDHSQTKKLINLLLANTHTSLGMDRSSDGSASEFLIDCGTLAEKLAWSAALESHTQYIEAMLRLQMDHRQLDLTEVLDPLKFSADVSRTFPFPSLPQPRAPTSSIVSGNNVVPTPSTQPTVSQGPASAKARPSVTSIDIATVNAGRRSFAGSVSSLSGTSAVTRGRRSLIGKNNKFLHLFHDDEEMQFALMVSKKGVLGLSKFYDLILLVNKHFDLPETSGVENRLSNANAQSSPCMRLLVVDSNSNQLDSEIIWEKYAKQPLLKEVKPGDKYFDIVDHLGRTQRFTPVDKITSQEVYSRLIELQLNITS